MLMLACVHSDDNLQTLLIYLQSESNATLRASAALAAPTKDDDLIARILA